MIAKKVQNQRVISMEGDQLLGLSTLGAWVEANQNLPSNFYRDAENVKQVPFDWSNISIAEKWNALFDSMPAWGGRPGTWYGLYLAEWIVSPIWLLNFIFGHIANFLGFSLKAIGDALTFMAVTYFYGFAETMYVNCFKGRYSRAGVVGVLIGLIKFLILGVPILMLLSPVHAVFAAFWVIAQPIHLLTNTINYMRYLVDGLTSLLVSFVGLFMWGDKTRYASITYCLEVVAINTLLLAPVALLIAFTIVPVAGQLSLFLGSIILNVGVTSAAGIAAHAATLLGLTVAYQAFTAIINIPSIGLRTLTANEPTGQNDQELNVLAPRLPGMDDAQLLQEMAAAAPSQSTDHSMHLVGRTSAEDNANALDVILKAEAKLTAESPR